MAVKSDNQKLGDALLSFARDGQFPEDASSIPPVPTIDLAPVIEELEKAKENLAVDIRRIIQETEDDLKGWEQQTKILQEDILRSKSIADDLERDFNASGKALDDTEFMVDFCNREFHYSSQLSQILKQAQHSNSFLRDAGVACEEKRVTDSLSILDRFSDSLRNIEVDDSVQVVKLLQSRASEIQTQLHQLFDQAWKEMLRFDIEGQKAVISETSSSVQMSLADSITALKTYKEMDERMEQLWHNLDAAIVGPRTDTDLERLPGVVVDGDVIQLQGYADPGMNGLISDLELILGSLSRRLPSELLENFCRFMMPDLVPRLINGWLNPAVPSNLTRTDDFEATIDKMDHFCQTLESASFSHLDGLREWVNNAPTVWLSKCRETALDTIRNNLGKGIGTPKAVEKVEKQMVSLAEGHELATTGAGATADTNDWADEWGDAWDNEHGGDESQSESAAPATKAPDNGAEDDGADAWGWGEEDQTIPDDDSKKQADGNAAEDAEDDSADAWGWGDTDETSETKTQAHAAELVQPRVDTRPTHPRTETRELVLKETYHISSLPDPLLEIIYSILEDGATLTRGEERYSRVASAASGLFSLPTFALALFRAISPSYYPLAEEGSMFLYNDAVYLADSLTKFAEGWKAREDITERAKKSLRLDNEIKSLRKFANRSYANGMNLQRTVLRDFLGGAQSIMDNGEAAAAIESATTRIRAVAATWEPILARSVWSQAIGSLAEALASKVIIDVLDMASISQDEAYNIATLIAGATELDDLFLPSRLSGSKTKPSTDEVPATAQYAPSWLRLKYLSEVLQSNLNEVKFLWCESELSLYFSVQEVVDLIEASFESNPRTKSTIREIQAKPTPTEG